LQQPAVNELERDKLILERTKLAADTVKHISTLATGSIVLVATFMDKVHKPIVTPNLLTIAIGAFMVCLFFCVIYLFLVGIPSRWDASVLRPKSVRIVMQVAAGILYLTFAMGVIILGFLAIANI
jgi:hypothetical protein